MLAWFLAGTAGYLICTTLAARLFYGVQRRQLIELDSRETPDPVHRFETDERPGVVVTAFLAGLAWPLTVSVYGGCRAMTLAITASPRPCRDEERLRAAQVQERIRDLERSLNLPETAADEQRP